MEKEGNVMSKVSATVTARDVGGKVEFSIDPDPINVPRGNHDIVISLVSETSDPTTFDTGDPIYYANGKGCPSSGKNCSQLDVVSCTDDCLTLGDNNDAPNTIGYQLNFVTGHKKEHLDPIIINN